MSYAYVLRSCKNGKLYTGHTENLERRILEHNTKSDKTKFSCVNGPWKLMFFEIFDTRALAMKHERFLKTSKGREYIQRKLGNQENRGVAQLA